MHHIIPSNFYNLFGLAKRLIQSKNSAGRAAMFYSFLGIIMIPLDWCFQFFEKQLYQKASKPKLPLIFVCGPPRSGTTLVAQVLIKHLPVYYFNNLTSIFPNSPVISNKVFRRFLKKGTEHVSFESLYGRTTNLSSPNDALYLWDRWTGVAREEIPGEISSEDQLKMQRFFGAVEAYTSKPVVNKNNKLNTYAHLVAEVLDSAYFICLDRDPVFLAQSQLIASKFIHGDENTPYGPRFESIKEKQRSPKIDPIELVCSQVMIHKETMLKQQEQIGKEHFIIVPYEDFCADPAKWVAKITDRTLGYSLDIEVLRKTLHPFHISNNIKLDHQIFSKIESNFEQSMDSE